MTINTAMQVGISGLSANGTKVGAISSNISNANTVGYKRGFAEMVTTTASAGAPSGVRAAEGNDIASQGGFRSTSSGTDLYIAGEGMFVVAPNPNETNEANFKLTRAGSFTPDENGNLVNAAGYYLQGYEYGDNGEIGLVDRNSFADMAPVNVMDVEMQAAATTSVEISGNMPAQATGVASPGSPFLHSTDIYSPLGEKGKMTFSWQPTTTDNTWTLQMDDENGNPYGSVDVTFDDSGPNSGGVASYSNVTDMSMASETFNFDTTTGQASISINNGATNSVVTVDVGEPGTTDGMTQFAGDYTPPQTTADGSTAGSLVRTEISEAGRVTGIFDNGTRKDLFQIPLADVPNENGLTPVDGNAFEISQTSGDMSLTTANSGTSGSIVSNSLERSNVDIAEELTDLIQTQRAYSSNAKIITTADEMLQETTNIKR
ncbi:flagellar hook protein FlgE [Salipiger mucosus]|uniref:Flagellar hook protein FlgE n=1 Tax=Salipiger mucosus DSM 16094 TaxID=1123237 RepID=S9RIU5_9RHOB|nr:flagellar hook protein FlgE [Salipiger mucosus]EPX78030.1 Flagellar hook protein FlgE [Salipiger mucosus DSM 16094]